MHIDDEHSSNHDHLLSQTAYDHACQRKPLAVSIKEFCRLTSLGRTSAFKLISSGTLETLPVGGRTLILWHSIEKLLGLGNQGGNK